jgi:hypothetical protein
MLLKQMPHSFIYDTENRHLSGSESKLSYLGHVWMENRNGLVVDTRLTRATGTRTRRGLGDGGADSGRQQKSNLGRG